MAKQSDAVRGAMCGLAAAALFGVSAPLAKILLGSISATLLAGLLYSGAALGLWLVRASTRTSSEAGLRLEDVSKLAVVVLAGGVAAPVLMLLGLDRLTAFSGSLLLNLEAPFTMLLAVLLFREHLGFRAGLASMLILAGALVLKAEPGELTVDLTGVLLIAAACACWALDNNLTQRLSLRDPFAVVRVKTSVAGLVNTFIATLFLAASWPSAGVLAGALALGAVSYGASVVLDAYALRLVGAAREAAYFATAPFLGALVSTLLLDDPVRSVDLLAMAVMGTGVVLLLRERHSHAHVHEPLEHEHAHSHDEHHQHEHAEGDPAGEPHSHAHRHDPIEHDHPHVPDLHHRHRH